MSRHYIYYLLVFFIFLSCRQEIRQGTSADIVPFKNKKEKWGYIDSIGRQTVIPCIYDKAYPFLFNTAIVGVNNEHTRFEFKYGVIDTLGNLIMPVKYEHISFPLNGYFVTYMEGPGDGVFDLSGKEIVPPVYNWIKIEKDTFAIVVKKVNDTDYYGCYNLVLRKEIIPCQYAEVRILNNQMIVVSNEGKYAYFNKAGEKLTPFKYDHADDFSDGLAEVKADKKYGFIDTAGKEVIPLKFDHICFPFNDSMTVVTWHNRNEVSIINTKGRIVYTGLHKWVDYCSHSSSGLVSFHNPKLGWGFINKQGKVVIPFMYNDLPEFGFNGNYARVGDVSKVYIGDSIHWENYKVGLIDKQNNLIYPFTSDYDYSVVSDSLICVYDKKLKKSKLVNSRKEEIIPYKYTGIETYNDSFFKVMQDSACYGLTDRQGREILPPEYRRIGQFHEGLALVLTEDFTGFINEAGRMAIICKRPYYENGDIFFKSGYAYVEGFNRRSRGYIDRKGNEYWIEGDGK